MRELFARYRDTATMAGFLVLFVAFIGTVLVPGYRLANDLSANSAALKLVSEQRGQPEVMMRLLAALRDQLREPGRCIVSRLPLKDIAATQVPGYDAALTQLGKSAAQHAPEFAEARQLWGALHAQVAPIAGFAGIPYSDSDIAGTRLSINAAGRELLEDARNALTLGRDARRKLSPSGEKRMTSRKLFGARLGAGKLLHGAATLRKLMIIGVAFALVLVALLLYVQLLKSRARARCARGPGPDPGYPGHCEGRLVPDRQRLSDRQGALGRPFRADAEHKSLKTASPLRTCSVSSLPENALQTATQSCRCASVLCDQRVNQTLSSRA